MFTLGEFFTLVAERPDAVPLKLDPAVASLRIGPVVIDSRSVEPRALFVALRGERTDGHRFLQAVFAAGAAAALVDRATIHAEPALIAGLPAGRHVVDALFDADLGDWDGVSPLLIAVDDPLLTLQRAAAQFRRRFTPHLIGITGSVGKTSVKELTAAVLAQRFVTLKSPRSYNSGATLPTVLFELEPQHEAAVLEMGMWAPGEIALLAQLAAPQIGIITNVGPTHLERMGSIEAIALAKGELAEALPADGWCILNGDDPRVAAMAARTAARVYRFGTSPGLELWAEEITGHGLDGLSFTVNEGDRRLRIDTTLVGMHHISTALAAAAVGRVLGLSWAQIRAGLNDRSAQPRIRVVRGCNGSTVIDDSYNAAPVSTRAALQLLRDLPGRRIAVLGEMLELGDERVAGHAEVGRTAVSCCDLLITVAEAGDLYLPAARAAGMRGELLVRCSDNATTAALLQTILDPGDYVLVKGSRGIQMETIVAAITDQSQGVSA